MFLSPFYCIQIVILYSTSRHAETLNGNHSVLFVWFPRIVLPVQVGIVDCIHYASISLYVFWYVIWMPVCWCPLPAGTFNPLAALVKTGWMSVSTGYRYSLILTRNRMLHRHKRKKKPTKERKHSTLLIISNVTNTTPALPLSTEETWINCRIASAVCPGAGSLPLFQVWWWMSACGCGL